MTPSLQTPDPRIIWPPEHLPRSAMVYTTNVVDISASPGAVWSLLLDCVRWPIWYKHCSDVTIVRGGAVLGPDSKFRFKTLGFYGEPEIRVFQPSRMLVWSAQGPAGLGGSHAWFIEPTPDGCRVITEEVQIGWLLFVVRSYIRRTLLTFHEEWLRALKELAEAKQ